MSVELMELLPLKMVQNQNIPNMSIVTIVMFQLMIEDLLENQELAVYLDCLL